ncbi:dipeptidase [Erysipelothrix larvae]|uniref:Dipeptidase n=1 Tax=Erysipelothrix larvae TaxID=1514105 RepID=A0A0X8H055_9FIRM|nr:Sapep family Mn(2+)-dependent dipeptidase [Erysipelothrix larvae]AMC93622.1 dipeptidase [Erysipelothrix larvae]
MANHSIDDSVFNKYLEDLKSLISIPSVLDENDSEHLFGEPVQQALTKILDISKDMGFKTYRNPQGYYGYAEIGEGVDLFGVLGHVDVVPEGNRDDWEADPFTLTQKDGMLIGRGVSDDKGPLLASMVALKMLLDEGYTLNQRVRFIFGTDEENLWRCVKEYAKLEEIPSMGFTPDSTFPLIYAEKGLIEFEFEDTQSVDFKIQGGGALNAVPAVATLQDTNLDLIKTQLENQNRHFKYDDSRITVYGKAVHAKDSDKGENAIVYLVQALVEGGVSTNMLRFITEKLSNPNGLKLFGPVEDEVSGKLMLNVGKIETTDTGVKIGIDIRFPVTYPVEKIRDTLNKSAAQYQVSISEYDYLRSIYVDKDTPLIKALMQAYQSVTQDTLSQPISSGGATYARALDNVVAFGAKLPSAQSTEHQVNERVNIDDMKTAIEIYKEAFKLLVSKN